MRRLLSLFDYSGQWSAPFYADGWDVIQIDLKHGNDISDFTCEHLVEELGIFDGGTVDGVIMAPPCEDFTKSGALWWDSKDKDGRTAASLFLVEQALATVEFVRPDFWALENPPGRLPKLVPFLNRCKRFDWDPCDFAGYIESGPTEWDQIARIEALAEAQAWDQITQADAELTKRLNRYKKRTAIFGHFPDLKTDRREPVKVCAAGSWIMRKNGTTKGKADRSDTPMGFAQAFFEAVKDYRLDWDAIDDGDAEFPIFDEVNEIPA